MREGFYDFQNVPENVTENVVENVVEALPETAIKFLKDCSKKKRETAEKILLTVAADRKITISEMATATDIKDRTVQRYLREFQAAGILRRDGSDTSGEWVLL